MKRPSLAIAISFVLLTWNLIQDNSFARSTKNNDGRNKYASLPTIFGEGAISTDDDELGASFSPDGHTCFFTKRGTSTIVSSTVVICVSHCRNGKWSVPEIAPFSGRYVDFNPCFSPDGSRLFFISNRPRADRKGIDTDIWYVEKSGENWGEPKNLGEPINSPGWELGCSAADDGTIYFSSTDTTGNADLYRSELADGKYQKPENLGDSVNSAFSETDPFIAPDESYLLFSSKGRPDAMLGPGASANYPRTDLYVSYRHDGNWRKAHNLGTPVNSDAEESYPSVSHDGKLFYFTSERSFVSIPMKRKLDYASLEKYLHKLGNGRGDIYQMPASAALQESH